MPAYSTQFLFHDCLAGGEGYMYFLDVHILKTDLNAKLSVLTKKTHTCTLGFLLSSQYNCPLRP